jgi:mediator of RNA polymerase II transcription subunit 25
MISSSQLGQCGVGASGLGPTAISSVPAMTPTPGMAQQTGANFLCVTNNFDISMSVGQHPNAQQPPSESVNFWEVRISCI